MRLSTAILAVLALIAAVSCLNIYASDEYSSLDEVQLFYSGEPVVFDVGGDIESGSKAYLDYGDGTTVTWSTTEVHTHTYSASGNYTFILYMCAAGESAAPLHCNGKAPTRTIVPVEINDRGTECYVLSATSTTLTSHPTRLAANMELQLAIHDPRGVLTALELGTSFHSVGFTPSITPLNSTEVSVSTPIYDAATATWKATVTPTDPIVILHSTLRLAAPQQHHGQCRVRSSTVDIVVVPDDVLGRFGATLPTGAYSRVAADISATQYLVADVGFATHPCVPSMTVAWMTGSGSSDKGLGTVVYYSYDSLQTVTPADLARVDELSLLDHVDDDSFAIPNTSVCVGLFVSQCVALTITSISFVGTDGSLALLTSMGPVHAQSPHRNAETLHDVVDKARYTRQTAAITSALNDQMTGLQWSNTMLSVPDVCPVSGEVANRMVAITVSENVDGSDALMMYCDMTTKYYAVPSGVTLSALSEAAKARYRVRSVSDIDKSIEYTLEAETPTWTLVNVPSALAIGDHSVLWINYATDLNSFLVLAHDKADTIQRVLQLTQAPDTPDQTANVTSWAVGHTFDAADTVTRITVVGPDVVAAGSSVWLGGVGDLVFRTIIALPVGVSAVFVSAQQRSPFMVSIVTSDRMIRTIRPPFPGVALVGPIRTTVHGSFTTSHGYRVDMADFVQPAAYPALNATYPQGLLGSTSSLAPAPFIRDTVLFGPLALEQLPLSLRVDGALVPDRLPQATHHVTFTPYHISTGAPVSAGVSLAPYLNYNLHVGDWAGTITRITSSLIRAIPTSPQPAAATTRPALLAPVTLSHTVSTAGVQAGDAVTLTLDLTGLPIADQIGWTADCPGMALHVSVAGSIMIKSVTSATVAMAVVVNPGQISQYLAAPVLAGEWWLSASRMVTNIMSLQDGQTVTVDAATPQTLTLAGPATSFEWTQAHVGHMVVLGGKVAVISDVASTTVAHAYPAADPIPAAAYGLTDAPLLSPAATECRAGSTEAVNWGWGAADVQPSLHRGDDDVTITEPPTPFMDKSSTISLMVNRPVASLTCRLTQPVGMDIVYSAVNASAAIVNVTNTAEGTATVILTGHTGSLKMAGGRATARVIAGCPPHDAIQFTSGITDDEMLAITSSTDEVELLPVNYRPPSEFGVAIPTTPNVYNADPSEPMYLSTDARSTSSWRYKQCSGKANRAACGCTAAMTISDDVNFSDCLDRVYRVYYGDTSFKPTFQYIRNGEVSGLLTAPYTIHEVNGRSDYCINPSGATCTSSVAELESTLVTPDMPIKFTGQDLYHFRVTVVGDSYCSLTAYFTIWVYESPTRTVMRWAQYSITGFTFAVGLAVAYCIHLKVSGKRFH